ncbi:TadA family conjugal transfer-associated ATPase [Nostocoides sp. F2B08]|uniref:TadA family conjugal transfer-associated ATPase n=1 Tax=Nostocoides sp. F2B08 TaxID=2653936 RepID=UPI00126381B3|nr:TadA family conjugal transfer-associated ATPase [Tetrasphaera sp. F2B08]KAB7746528.1 TadA family conjugal transfer-associated ATPase [Tetrasphaera sp. F2B08]
MDRMLRELTADASVTDVLINGDGTIWVDRGARLERAPQSLPDPDAVRRLAVRLAAAADRRLDDSLPYADGQLPGGLRLHAVLAPVACDGAHISLRVARRRPFTLADLEAAGSITGADAARLRSLVVSRRTILVTGGTGSGKTTLLGALLDSVAPRERIVLVEDVAELVPAHPHVVRLQSRHRNVEGAGEVTMADLVRQAMRMRPDRIVVGEVRGAEVIDLFRALNTGHEGGFATVHANSAADVMARLEALGTLAGLSPAAVRTQAVAAIDVVVHLERTDGRRRVSEIVAWPLGTRTKHRDRAGPTEPGRRS